MNGSGNNNFIRLKGTDLKFDMSKLTQLKRTRQNESIFDKLDSNRNGTIEQEEIQTLYDAAGNAILWRREAKKAGWDFNDVKMFAEDQAAQIKAQAESTEVHDASIEELDNSFIEKANAMLKASSSTIESEGIYLTGEGLSTYTVTHNEDGGYTRTYDNGEIRNFDANGRRTGGKLEDGTQFNIKYANDGTSIGEFTRADGSQRYQKYDKNDKDTEEYAERTVNGDIEADAINGETFKATMERLGITDPADQEAFRQANPKAAKREYFRVGMHDVIMPKKVADKLDMNNVVVNSDAQARAWKQAVEKK